MRKKTYLILLLLTTVFALTPLYNSFASNESDKVDEFMSMLKSEVRDNRRIAARKIAQSNLSDPKLFDLIEENLLKGYMEPNEYHKHIDEMQLYCEALASSGLLKYRDTLEKVSETAENSFILRSASGSLRNLEKNYKKKKLLEEEKIRLKDNGLTDEAKHFIIQLKSGDLKILRNTAKELYSLKYTNEKVLNAANEVLLEEFSKTPQRSDYDDEEYVEYGTTPSERMRYDAICWLSNILGQSNDPKYLKTLKLIAKETLNDKVRKYAKHNIKKLR